MSIIIPTLNEEKRLPRLLKSIKKQSFSDYEIIVADGGSKDKTTEFAKKQGCKVTSGGSPAKARNSGAKIAHGDLLLFLDADVVLSEGFFIKVLSEFRKRGLDVAGFYLLSDKKSRISAFILHLFYNFPIMFLSKLSPYAQMGGLIKKKLFDKVEGFDESIKLAEDHDLAKRAGKIGKYGMIKSVKICISMRRFETDGWVRTYAKYILAMLHLLFFGPIRSDIFKYKFDIYKK